MDYKQTHVAHEHKHGRPLMSCRFAGPTSIVFGAEDYSVWKWDWKSNEKVRFETDAWVRALAVVQEGRTILTGGYDGRLLWWKSDMTESKAPLRVLDAHEGWLRAMAVSPDGKRVATTGNDQRIRIWKIEDGSLVQELNKAEGTSGEAPSHESYIYNVAFHPTESALVTGDLMGQLIHWNLDSGQAVRGWEAKSLSKYDKTFRAQIGGFRDLFFSRDGSRLYGSGITNVTNAFAGVGNPSVVEFSWKEGEQLHEYLSKPKLQGVAWGARVHPEDVLIAAHGGSGGTLVFWELEHTEAAHQLKLSQNARDLDLHNDGQHVAVACSDGKLHVCLLAGKA